jgi:hypothetical protein
MAVRVVAVLILMLAELEQLVEIMVAQVILLVKVLFGVEAVAVQEVLVEQVTTHQVVEQVVQEEVVRQI